MVKKYWLSDRFDFLDWYIFPFFNNSVRAFLDWLVKNEPVILKPLSCFNPYFLIFSHSLKMPKLDKSKSINIANKWKNWYIKTDRKLFVFWLSTLKSGVTKIRWYRIHPRYHRLQVGRTEKITVSILVILSVQFINILVQIIHRYDDFV